MVILPPFLIYITTGFIQNHARTWLQIQKQPSFNLPNSKIKTEVLRICEPLKWTPPFRWNSWQNLGLSLDNRFFYVICLKWPFNFIDHFSCLILHLLRHSMDFSILPNTVFDVQVMIEICMDTLIIEVEAIRLKFELLVLNNFWGLVKLLSFIERTQP